MAKIGRGGEDYWVDLTLTAGTKVSREHCHIRRDASGAFFLRDVSAWGTRLNGQRLVKYVDGDPAAAEYELPDGASITFDGVRRWASLQVARNPGTGPALAAAVLALAGLMMSLFVRRRRVWVRASTTDGGRTLVEVAGLTRHEGGAARCWPRRSVP